MNFLHPTTSYQLNAKNYQMSFYKEKLKYIFHDQPFIQCRCSSGIEYSCSIVLSNLLNSTSLIIFVIAIIYAVLCIIVLYLSKWTYMFWKQGPHSDFEGPNCGSTACVALIRDRQLVVANAGDSRCVLSRKGQVISSLFLVASFYVLKCWCLQYTSTFVDYGARQVFCWENTNRGIEPEKIPLVNRPNTICVQLSLELIGQNGKEKKWILRFNTSCGGLF